MGFKSHFIMHLGSLQFLFLHLKPQVITGNQYLYFIHRPRESADHLLIAAEWNSYLKSHSSHLFLTERIISGPVPCQNNSLFEHN